MAEKDFVSSVIERKKKGMRIFEKQIVAEIAQRGLDEAKVVRMLIRNGLIPEAKDEETEEEKINRFYYL